MSHKSLFDTRKRDKDSQTINALAEDSMRNDDYLAPKRTGIGPSKSFERQITETTKISPKKKKMFSRKN